MKKELTIVKQGAMQDSELAVIISDVNFSREQKDAAITQYLFQRGMESASFLAEIIASKGFHTKETRAFKSQVRFDFEQFIGIMNQFFLDASRGLRRDLGVSDFKWEEIKDELLKGNDTVLGSKEKRALLKFAFRMEDEAVIMKKAIDKTTINRMREAGYGIYIDKNGKPYSIFEDEIEEAVKKDKEETKNEQV